MRHTIPSALEGRGWEGENYRLCAEVLSPLPKSSGPDFPPPNMTLWTLHCHILFENLFLGFQQWEGVGPFRSPHRSWGRGKHVSQLGAQIYLSPQSWARGNWTEFPLSPSAFPSPLPPYFLPPGSPFSFALSQLFSLLPLGGCHSFLLLPFLFFPFSPSLLPLLAQLWEHHLPVEKYEGGHFWGPLNSSYGI